MIDIIIAGGGPAGLSAGIYACRGGMNTVLFEKTVIGGQTATTELVENYPGFPEGINGYDLTDKMKRQAEKFGLDIRAEAVKKITRKGREIVVETETGKYQSIAVIAAPGCRPRELGIPGEEELRGKGVSYCATCDGPLFRDKEITVVGGGNTAVEEALFLAGFGKFVRLIHRRSRLRAAKILQERLLRHSKIEFVKDSVVVAINGKDVVESLSLKNVKTGAESEVPCAGVFIAVGLDPNTGFLKGTVEMNEKGYIITDENMKTSAEGIYACGDVREKTLRQVVNACGEGAVAAFSAQKHVEELKGTAYGEDFPI
jgi:thioredoxin reductase (NADPH)